MNFGEFTIVTPTWCREGPQQDPQEGQAGPSQQPRADGPGPAGCAAEEDVEPIGGHVMATTASRSPGDPTI